MSPKPKTSQQATWRIRTTLGGIPTVPWRAGTFLLPHWRSVVDADDVPYLIELEFSADAKRGPRCKAITFRARDGGQPVSPSAIRGPRLGAMIDHAVAEATWRGERRDGGWSFTPPSGLGDTNDELEAARSPQRKMTPEHLREVAGIYLAAHDAGENPTHAVWDHYDFKPAYSTVARWVERARRDGLIPPAASRRARGTTTEKED